MASIVAQLPAAASGFLLGASLIVAIGSQNAFILRMGIERSHVFVLCLVCALADAVLIVAGIAGMGAAVAARPGLLQAIGFGGAAFLFAYAALSVRRALHPKTLAAAGGPRPALAAALAQCLAFTFLNPHVYLDTVVLVGAYSTAQPGQAARIAFGVGAAAASFAWFFALGYGARLLAPLFGRQIAWRVLDAGIAVIMFALGATLLRSAVYQP